MQNEIAEVKHLLVLALNCMEFGAHREVVACSDSSQQQRVVILEMPPESVSATLRERGSTLKKINHIHTWLRVCFGRDFLRCRGSKGDRHEGNNILELTSTLRHTPYAFLTFLRCTCALNLLRK